MAIGQQLSDSNPDGTSMGQSASDLISFYGVAAVSQRASSVQATSNIASSASFGATQTAVLHEIMNTLTGLGIWKGTA